MCWIWSVSRPSGGALACWRVAWPCPRRQWSAPCCCAHPPTREMWLVLFYFRARSENGKALQVTVGGAGTTAHAPRGAWRCRPLCLLSWSPRTPGHGPETCHFSRSLFKTGFEPLLSVVSLPRGACRAWEGRLRTHAATGLEAVPSAHQSRGSSPGRRGARTACQAPPAPWEVCLAL